MKCAECGSPLPEEGGRCPECGMVNAEAGKGADGGPAAPEPENGMARDGAADPGADGAPAPTSYVGVKGWLLFLCIGITILSPLRLGADIWSELSVLDAIPRTYQAIRYSLYFEIALLALGVVGSVVFGSMLWAKDPRAPRAVRWFIAFIKASMGVFLIAFHSALAKQVGPYAADRAMSQVVGVYFVTLAVAVAWIIYLMKSRRVRDTYGPAAAPWAPEE